MNDEGITFTMRTWIYPEPVWWLVISEYIVDHDPGDEDGT